MIIDVKPKDLGLPTEAYISVEEVHDVSIISHVFLPFPSKRVSIKGWLFGLPYFLKAAHPMAHSCLLHMGFCTH